jgi:crossover junction endodeoxyribonuclease RusA
VGPVTVHPIRPGIEVPDLPDTVAETLRSWQLTRAGRPVPMNEYRKLHWTARRDHDQMWRADFAWLARAQKIPPLEVVTIQVVQTCRPGVTMPDPGACYPTAKAAIDGLVDAGVIPDDSGAHVRYLGFGAPARSDRDRFVLVVEPAEAG